MDLKKMFLPKWARKTLFKAEAVDGKMTRVRCNVYINSNDITTLDNTINDMIKFRDFIKTRYGIQ